MSHKWSCICATCEAGRNEPMLASAMPPAHVVGSVVFEPALVSDAATARLGDSKTPRWFEALRDPVPPCHLKPREQRCDRDGPGGFMGHTWDAGRGDAVIDAEAFVELLAAARAVLVERDRFDGQDLLDTIDDALERLRRALP